MFLMKPKFKIYTSSFISLLYARYTQLILPKSYMHQGVLFWPTYGLKNAFHHFVLIGLLEQFTKLKSKTFKLTFIFAMVTKNGHQNELKKNGKANILEQI